MKILGGIPVKVNRPENHNPSALICEARINADSFITCVKPLNDGPCQMEYYSGENYVIGSNARSYSRIYSEENIPGVYSGLYNALKEFTEKYYRESL